jgi:hypothetical protein
MCGSEARVMLVQLNVQFKTRWWSTFEAERLLMHPLTEGPASQPHAQHVDASQRCASTMSICLIRVRSPSTSRGW